MQIIRSKRATSTAGANNTAGQTKSKYRKRSVSQICYKLLKLKLIVHLPLFGLDSGPPLLENAILAIFEKRPSGVGVQMGHALCAMLAGFVRIIITT